MLQGAADFKVRVSELGSLEIISIAGSSIVQLGDRAELNASVRGLSVQREINHEDAGDAYFESYSIFDKPLPAFPAPSSEDDYLFMRKQNKNQRISVGCIYVIAVSSAASILIGNGMKTTAESRIKHIRQFAEYSSPTP
ncbi:spore germination protein GerPE [Paenibacillus solisilvae]|uniref:Spore germination protein GerPE n=2 Tax=Paenibacillus solisilvae TaxID=2486751 RepID=A0ABW0W602_9BACL